MADLGATNGASAHTQVQVFMPEVFASLLQKVQTNTFYIW